MNEELNRIANEGLEMVDEIFEARWTASPLRGEKKNDWKQRIFDNYKESLVRFISEIEELNKIQGVTMKETDVYVRANNLSILSIEIMLGLQVVNETVL